MSGGLLLLSAVNTATTSEAPSISGGNPTINNTTPDVGDVLTVTTGSWIGTPSITFTYQWQSAPSPFTSWTDESGATSNSYSVVSGDIGNELRCVVTATNGVSSTSQASAATSAVTSASLIPTPSVLSTFTSVAFDDEFNDAAGMSGHTNGLSTVMWNYGWYFGPSGGIGASGYRGLSRTSSVGGGAVNYYGANNITLPPGGGLKFTASNGVDNSGSYTDGSGTYTRESGAVNTIGLMHLNPNPAYDPSTVSTAFATSCVSAEQIVVEIDMQIPGPTSVASHNWPIVLLYNVGDSNLTGVPNAGSYTEEIDIWEWDQNGSIGSDGHLTLHQASSYGSVVSVPSGLGSTDLSLAMHTYTVLFDWTNTLGLGYIATWVDGTQASTVTPTQAEMQAQFATPAYLLIAYDFASAAPNTGAGSPAATPMQIDYVRVWTPGGAPGPVTPPVIT